jgi:hypothetical protein
MTTEKTKKSRVVKPELSARSAVPNSARRERGAMRTLLAIVFVAAAFGGGSYAVWRQVREHVYRSPHYHLSLDDIIVTPRPEWIHTDVTSEVIKDASVDGPLSVLDDRLLDRLREAFALHPWVARVERVAKRSPARVEVDLVYRRPACMVQVPGGLYPVDAEGVLLLTADFSPVQASRYPRLSGTTFSTAPPPGIRWPDERVLGGAEIAAVLADVWHEMEFEQIALSANSAASGSAGPEYDILTRQGTRILWGPAPGVDEAGRSVAADKVARLKHYFSERGTLEGPRGSQDLDLRGGAGLQVSPHTAMRDEN